MRRYRAVVEMGLQVPISAKLIVEVEAENCQDLARDIKECLQLVRSSLTEMFIAPIKQRWKRWWDRVRKAAIDKWSIFSGTWRGKR